MINLAAFNSLFPQAIQRILTNEPMARHTTFQVGGPADVFFEPATVDEIRTAIGFANENGIPVTILGNGSNVVVADKGIRGLVISLGSHFAANHVIINRIEAQAGLQFAHLSAIALRHSLGGMEFASGIPGTVGGAVMMNAGAYDHSLADVIVEATCLTAELELLSLPASELMLSYRHSIFTDGERLSGSIILSMTVDLPHRPASEIRQEIIELGRRRSASQPLEWPSAGSSFKRPPGFYAGRLISDCGLKGCRVGDAEVSEKHAGFVINRSAATASDICRLFRKVQKEVWLQKGVRLWPEVRFIGDWTEDEQSDLPDRDSPDMILPRSGEDEDGAVT